MDIDMSPGSTSPSCYYYSEGEYLSEHNRKVWFKSDPIDSLTVLWKSCSDTYSPVNFGEFSPDRMAAQPVAHYQA